MIKPYLTIVRGIPGSGKTSFVKEAKIECIHLEADMLCVRGDEYLWEPSQVRHNHDTLHKIAALVMDRGADLVISNTFTQKWEFRDYIDYAQNRNYEVGVIRMTGEFENSHGVPQDIVDKMRKRFEDYEGEVLVPVQK